MDRTIVDTIHNCLDTLSEVMGIDLWIVTDQTDYGRHKCRGLRGERKPGDFQEAAEVECRCGSKVLVVPVSGADQKFIVRSSHLPSPYPWVQGAMHGKSPADASFDINVQASSMSTALIATVASVAHEVVTNNPDQTGRLTDDIGSENIRRIAVSVGQRLGDGVFPASGDLPVNSFQRVPPMREFVRLTYEELGVEAPKLLTQIFDDITSGLDASFNLMDLSGTILISPHRFCPLCDEVFRKHGMQQCIVSDVSALWRAILRSRITTGEENPQSTKEYTCWAGFTENVSPVLAEGLGVGGVFAGQIVKSEEQRNQIFRSARRVLKESTRGWSPAGKSEVGAMLDEWGVIPQESPENVKKVCTGITGLTNTMYEQWCRTQSGVGLRRGLLQGASEGDVEALMTDVCEAVLDYVDVSFCTVFTRRDDRLVLTASTAPLFYVRERRGADPQQVTREALLGEAYYELGQGLTGTAALQREALHTESAKSKENWWGKLSECPGDCHLVAVPIERDDELFGVLRAGKAFAGGRIPHADFALLQDFAHEFAIAIAEKRLTTQLREAADEARTEAERFRNLLFATSHEFRQPLHNILSQISVLRKHSSQSPRAKQIMDEMEEQAYRAERQMRNALTFGGTLECDFAESDLGALIESCARQFHARAADRGIKIITWDSAKRLPRIEMDRDQIAQVVTNLVDNAVKYSFRGENIDIRGNKLQDAVRFSVQDRGIGIPADKRDGIFKPFARLPVRDPTREIAGTGIGLTLVKNIVEAHGGSIDVSSEPFLDDPRRQSPEDGHVVTFTVTLPRRRK